MPASGFFPIRGVWTMPDYGLKKNKFFIYQKYIKILLLQKTSVIHSMVKRGNLALISLMELHAKK